MSLHDDSRPSEPLEVKILLMKAALLLAPFIALSVPTVWHTVVVVVRAEHSLGLREGVFDERMEGKIRAFVNEGTVVIVAGDSRAERQIVPAIIEQRTGWRAANIATDGGDLVTVSNALKRRGLPGSLRMLIVSTSLFQVNDGAIDPPYISTACLLNMTGWERLRIYTERLGRPWSPLDFRFVEGPPAVIAGAALQEQGFIGIERRLSLPLPKTLLNVHPWYRSLSLHGVRWRVFREALAGLAASGVRVYLLQPPVSPAWRTYTAGTFVDNAEREFAGMLGETAKAYPNVRLMDFYSVPDPQLGNDQFSDIQHLNRAGAARFTGILMDQIAADLKLDTEGSREESRR